MPPRTFRLSPRVAASLCYLAAAGPILFFLEKRRPIVRFHAAQATLLLLVAGVFHSGISLLRITAYRWSWYAGLKTDAVLWWFYLLEIALWVVLVYLGYTLDRASVPWVGRVARLMCGTESPAEGHSSALPGVDEVHED